MTAALVAIIGVLLLAIVACLRVAGDCSEQERQQENDDAKGGD